MEYDYQAKWVSPQPVTMRPPLRRAGRASEDMPIPILAGVCSGLSVHLRISVLYIRLAIIVSSLFIVGIVFYTALACLLPLDRNEVEEKTKKRFGKHLLRIGVDHARELSINRLYVIGTAVLLFAIALLGLTLTGVLRWVYISPIVMGISGIALIWTQSIRVGSNRHTLSFFLIIVSGFFLLEGAVIWSVLIVTVLDDAQRLILLGASVVISLAIGLAPLGLRVSSTLSISEKERIREAERADISAHLHDSVLQTLTLIRSYSDNPVRVRALALTQERELRSWLYTGYEDAGSSFSAMLAKAVEEIEATYGVEVSVVSVGDTIPGPNEVTICAATSEAVKNAVRHAQPPISVYAEITDSIVEIFVRDHGTGFNITSIPTDRHGVRNSIVGRMQRIGGSATIKSNEQGTEVHMQVVRTPIGTA